MSFASSRINQASTVVYNWIRFSIEESVENGNIQKI